ncbi:hypothetical protein ISE1_4453 [plant metagenome]|uniref:Uncharacterized protein n=1 Tax=plant metagenome TaxID=1297885 RepID=A0A484TFS4_9ZZZZ
MRLGTFKLAFCHDLSLSLARKLFNCFHKVEPAALGRRPGFLTWNGR